jgi:antitoxin component of MazEF toxin-antitoxin module
MGRGRRMGVVKKLTRLGGSKAVVLPQAFLEQMNVSETDEVELTMTPEGVLVRAHRYLSAEDTKAIGRKVVAKRRSALERLAK